MKHRPRRFEDVIGQGAAVADLSRRARARDRKPLLMVGPTGAGKTSLATIFARALLCEAPTPSGSPCLVCASCRAMDEGAHVDFEFYPANSQKIEHVDELIRSVLPFAPMASTVRVVVFDEAGASPRSQKALLGEFEQSPLRAQFVWTTLSQSDLMEPLCDRMHIVTLAPAAPEAALAYLERICAAEGVSYEAEGLELLAASCESFRLAAKELEALAAAGVVTEAAVRATTLTRRFGWIQHYLDAVLTGDLSSQLEAIEQEDGLDPSTRASQLLEALTTLKLRFIGPGFAPKRVRLSPFSDAASIAVLEGFERIALDAATSLPALWDDVLAWWSYRPAALSEAALRAHPIRFHDLLHGSDSSARPPLGASRIALVPGVRRPTAQPSSVAQPRRRHGSSARGEVLSRSQVTELYEAATFALQAYWAPFNLSVQLDWPAAAESQDAVMAAHAARLAHLFDLRLQDWSTGGSSFHRVLVHERRNGQFTSTLIGHVPEDQVMDAEKWLTTTAPTLTPGARISPSTFAQRRRSRRETAVEHWRLLSALWRGAEPGVAEALGIPVARRIPAGRVACRRFSISESLSVSARRRAGDELYPVFSAIAEGRWDWIETGWEADVASVRAADLKSVRKSTSPDAEAGLGGLLEEMHHHRSVAEIGQKQIDRWKFRQPPWARN